MKPSAFMALHLRITHRNDARGFTTDLKQFRSFYGCSPSNCAILWAKIRQKKLAPRAEPKHLLWALMFLKLYNTEEAFAGFLGVDKDTFSEWLFHLVKAIAKLRPDYVSILQVHSCFGATNNITNNFYYQVKWQNRHRGHSSVKAKVSVDGTDFRLRQQDDGKLYYSHKFKSSGYRYEVAISIEKGDIVWVNGPFPCGAFPDINIFRRGLKNLLLRSGEKAQADLGYRGEPIVIIVPNEYDSKAIKKLKADVRARHETANRRLKQYGVLFQVFRHSLDKHKHCFDACDVLAQMEIISGEPLYQVQY